jgi:FdhD protein
MIDAVSRQLMMRLAPERNEEGERLLAAEVPLSLAYNGVAHAVMMISPQDIEDFVHGFSWSERIVEDISEIGELSIREVAPGFLAQISIPPERQKALLAGRRTLVGQTGCGICGVVELEAAIRNLPPIHARPQAGKQAIFTALADLGKRQPLNQATGSVHAAAFVDARGSIQMLREDVGRHNAFDKLIGAILLAGLSPHEGFVLLTSRCSFELVQKAVVLGVPLLATISAPTTLAVELAQRAGLTLIALARSDSLLCFSDPHGLFGNG